MSEVKLEPFQKVLVRDNENQEWRASFFSHMATYKDRPIYVTTVLAYYECLPYEGNEHLLGTTNSPTPPELEFKWGDHVEVRDDEHQEWVRAVFCYKKPVGYYCIVCPINYNHWKQCRHADW